IAVSRVLPAWSSVPLRDLNPDVCRRGWVLLPCGREDEPRLTCPSFGGPVAVASEQVGVEHRIPASSGEVDSSVLANPTAPANLGDVEPVPAHEPGHVALGDPVAALARPAILANHLDFNLREHCVSSRLWLLIPAYQVWSLLSTHQVVSQSLPGSGSQSPSSRNSAGISVMPCASSVTYEPTASKQIVDS